MRVLQLVSTNWAIGPSLGERLMFKSITCSCQTTRQKCQLQSTYTQPKTNNVTGRSQVILDVLKRGSFHARFVGSSVVRRRLLYFIPLPRVTCWRPNKTVGQPPFHANLRTLRNHRSSLLQMERDCEAPPSLPNDIRHFSRIYAVS